MWRRFNFVPYRLHRSGRSHAGLLLYYEFTMWGKLVQMLTHLKRIVQTVAGRRNKYLINGYLAQPSRVQNLFHSEQLNVNNPHFLIMQHHITKVLNMKPPEILFMLEEAAGTRMYETKKEIALKTLEKKQVKLMRLINFLISVSSFSYPETRLECSTLTNGGTYEIEDGLKTDVVVVLFPGLLIVREKRSLLPWLLM